MRVTRQEGQGEGAARVAHAHGKTGLHIVECRIDPVTYDEKVEKGLGPRHL